MKFSSQQKYIGFGDDHLIPMINVIFLMLIFFMIVGSVKATEVLLVSAPVAQPGKTQQEAEIHLLLGQQQRLAIDNKTVTWEQASTVLQQKVKVLGPEIKVSLKADASTTALQLKRCFELLAQQDIPRVTLLTTGAY